MAITRSQQFRQMLIKGGVANPDGRRGFFKGAQDDTRKGSPMSPGTSVGGNTRGGTGKGRDLDFQQRGMTKSEYNRRRAEGTIDRYKGPDGPLLPPQLRKDRRFIPTPVPKGINFFDRTRNKLIQSRINRDKRLALQRLGLIPKTGFTGFIGTTIDALTGKIPEQFELMSEEDLLNIATSGPYLSQQKTKGDVSQFASGKDLLGRVFEAEDLLRKGDMTQTKFDELFPGPNIPDDRDGPEDPCLGPNPPAYCFVGIRSAAPIVEDTEDENPLSKLTPRIAGSRFAAAGGGIASLEDMDREGFLLGGIAKGLKKAVRGIKKLAKSPIGKAALGFAALQYGGGLGGLVDKFKNLSTLQKVGFGIGATSLAAGAMTPKEDKFNLDSYYASGQTGDVEPFPRIAGSKFDFYGGRIASAEGGSTDKEPVAKKTMPLLDMGGKEMDLREEGGFVPIGRMEKADDVPARLSKNEFVFTADAVRNAGDGNVDKGAEVMYNMMKNLEAGGDVSEESQGLEGARNMFQTSKRLEEVI